MLPTVPEFLLSLGTSASEVARALRKLQLRGLPDNEWVLVSAIKYYSTCPQDAHFTDVYLLEYGPAPAVAVIMPAAIRQFIDCYGLGMFRELTPKEPR